MNTKFKITNVDMYGLNGRENHPKPSDVGLVVIAVSMSSEEGTFGERVTDFDSLFAAKDNYEEQNSEKIAVEDSFFSIYVCVTEDGRTLELANYEIEPVETTVICSGCGAAEVDEVITHTRECRKWGNSQ